MDRGRQEWMLGGIGSSMGKLNPWRGDGGRQERWGFGRRWNVLE